MTQADSPHLSDELLTELVDGRLSLPAATAARAHLRQCSMCVDRFSGMEHVLNLLRDLPEVDPPRDFLLGPRALGGAAASNNGWRRWYDGARLLASASAALFVVLLGSDAYLAEVRVPAEQSALTSEAPAPDAAAGTANTGEAAKGSDTAAAPAAQPVPAARSPRQDAPSAGEASPAESLSAEGPPASALESAQSAPSPEPTPDPTDQRAASTSQRPLRVPTPFDSDPAAVQAVAGAPARPLQIGGLLAGIVAATSAIGALALRHRIRRADAQPKGDVTL